MTENRTKYDLRPATAADFSFLRDLHRSTLKPYVEIIWGWDENLQEELLRERFDPRQFSVIQLNGRDIGILQVERRPGELFIGNILLLPVMQNRGLGSAVIGDLLKEAKIEKLAATLTVLKPNPAKHLYERLGFRVVSEDGVRYFMKFAGD